jgi:hypothetical protein
MKTTPYFRDKVLKERPYLNMEWIEAALSDALELETQPNGRIRRWVYVEEYGKYLRVITLDDGETVHNAFFDRGYARRMK